jgi:hypothetical protein
MVLAVEVAVRHLVKQLHHQVRHYRVLFRKAAAAKAELLHGNHSQKVFLTVMLELLILVVAVAVAGL